MLTISICVGYVAKDTRSLGAFDFYRRVYLNGSHHNEFEDGRELFRLRHHGIGHWGVIMLGTGTSLPAQRK
jgi:hypothetical protein